MLKHPNSLINSDKMSAWEAVGFVVLSCCFIALSNGVVNCIGRSSSPQITNLYQAPGKTAWTSCGLQVFVAHSWIHGIWRARLILGLKTLRLGWYLYCPSVRSVTPGKFLQSFPFSLDSSDGDDTWLHLRDGPGTYQLSRQPKFCDDNNRLFWVEETLEFQKQSSQNGSFCRWKQWSALELEAGFG